MVLTETILIVSRNLTLFTLSQISEKTDKKPHNFPAVTLIVDVKYFRAIEWQMFNNGSMFEKTSHVWIRYLRSADVHWGLIYADNEPIINVQLRVSRVGDGSRE